MNPLQQIASLILNTGVDLYIFVLWMRFLLQAQGADFYNPLSQFVVKATHQLVDPLDKLFQKRAQPGVVTSMRKQVQRWSFGALLLIVLIKLLQVAVISVLVNGYTPSPLVTAYVTLLNFPMGGNIVFTLSGLLSLLINFYFYAIIAGVILSWIAPGNPAGQLIFQIVEPILGPCRRLLPSMGGLDLSPIIAFLGLQIAEILARWSVMQIAMILGL